MSSHFLQETCWRIHFFPAITYKSIESLRFVVLQKRRWKWTDTKIGQGGSRWESQWTFLSEKHYMKPWRGVKAIKKLNIRDYKLWDVCASIWHWLLYGSNETKQRSLADYWKSTVSQLEYTRQCQTLSIYKQFSQSCETNHYQHNVDTANKIDV